MFNHIIIDMSEYTVLCIPYVETVCQPGLFHVYVAIPNLIRSVNNMSVVKSIYLIIEICCYPYFEVVKPALVNIHVLASIVDIL